MFMFRKAPPMPDLSCKKQGLYGLQGTAFFITVHCQAVPFGTLSL